MTENAKPRLSEPLPDVCPYLGLHDDPDTYSAYSTQWNACYHSKPVSTPSLIHQSEFCLTENHVNCVLYQTSDEIKMSKRMQFQSKGTSLKAKTRRLIIFFSAGILLIVIAMIFSGHWFSALFGIPSPARTPTRNIISSTEFELLTTSTSGTLAASIPIDQIQVTSTPTMIVLTPTSTHTPQKPPLALETPIGSELEIVIHRVVEGESLLLFANWYQTSTDVIQAVNLNLTYPIKSGDLVIIPVGVMDAANLPPFEPYEVTADSISVKVLAEQLNVPLVDLCFYNNIDENLILNAGDWLVIPRPSTSP